LRPSKAIERLRSSGSISTSIPIRSRVAKPQLEDGAADVFGLGSGNAAEPVVDVKALHAKIGELTLENDF
jgi:hypothetical protein